MKRFLLIIVSIIFVNVDSFTQISSFGLQDMKVTDLKIYGDTLYACTVDSGVYRRNLNDTGWVNLGLKGKNITSVYPHPVDSQGYNLTVGVWICCSLEESTLIYSISPYGWVPDDSGIGYDIINQGIVTIDGFTYPGNNSLMFAGGYCYNGGVFRRSNKAWESISPQDYVNVIKISPIGDVWVGVGSGCAIVFKSTDKGNTWTEMIPFNPCGLGHCKDIAFHPNNPDIVYIAGLGIQKTTNGGLSWQETVDAGDDLAIDPFDGNHVFAGSSYYGWLFETTDGGLNWDTILQPEGADRISGLEINITDSLELYIVTDSTGVYRLTQPSLACGRMISVDEGWNMLSVPNRVHDFCKNILLPSSISSAFTYENSYINKDTLQNGKGYWSKFNSSNVIKFIGEKITSDSIDVNLGWNMIGSISYPVRVSSISSDPPDMIVNDFFTYADNRYISSDTIQPGHAYWVKTNKSGKLILDTTSSIMTNKLINIIPNGELPPPPPGDQQIALKEIPNKFALEQNHPNPFNPSTMVNYQLPIDNFVTIRVYNILGEEMITLVNGFETAGYKSVTFDASSLPSGVYFYKIQAGKFIDVKKMILTK